ncbi:MAG: hypothetical protein HY335_02670 [Deinococcus sp.]|nr:hypothetical protein [Deinococcus sp.]
MTFVVHSINIGDAQRRSALREAHVGFLRQLKAQGVVILAGPYGDGSGGLIMLQAESLEAAQRLMAQDPFVLGGVARQEIKSFTQSV